MKYQPELSPFPFSYGNMFKFLESDGEQTESEHPDTPLSQPFSEEEASEVESTLEDTTPNETQSKKQHPIDIPVVRTKKKVSNTPFIKAAKDGNLNLVKLLFESMNVDANLKKGKCQEAILLASTRGHTDIVLFLASYLGAKTALIDTLGVFKRNILMLTALTGHHDTFIALISFFSQSPVLHQALSMKDTYHYSVLMLAALSDSDRIIAALSFICEPNYINATNKDGYTALSLAAHHNALNSLRMLMNLHGIDLMCTNPKNEMTPLNIACFHGHLEAVKILTAKLEKKDLDKIYKDGYTTLMLSIKWEHFDVAMFLVDLGADIDIINKFKQNALTLAAKTTLSKDSILIQKLKAQSKLKVEKKPNHLSDQLKQLTVNLRESNFSERAQATLTAPLPTAILSAAPFPAKSNTNSSRGKTNRSSWRRQ